MRTILSGTLLASAFLLIPTACMERVAEMKEGSSDLEVAAATSATSVRIAAPVVIHGRFDFNRVYTELPDGTVPEVVSRDIGALHMHDIPVSGPMTRDRELWVDLQEVRDVLSRGSASPSEADGKLSLAVEIRPDATASVSVVGVREGALGEEGWIRSGDERRVWAMSRPEESDDTYFLVRGVSDPATGSLVATYSDFEEYDVATTLELDVEGGGSLLVSGSESEGWRIQAAARTP